MGQVWVSPPMGASANKIGKKLSKKFRRDSHQPSEPSLEVQELAQAAAADSQQQQRACAALDRISAAQRSAIVCTDRFFLDPDRVSLDNWSRMTIVRLAACICTRVNPSMHTRRQTDDGHPTPII